MAKRTWRWVSRDKDSLLVDVWPWRKPSLGHNGVYAPSVWGDWAATFRLDDFVAVFGLTIKPGELRKVQFGKAKVIKERGDASVERKSTDALSESRRGHARRRSAAGG